MNDDLVKRLRGASEYAREFGAGNDHILADAAAALESASWAAELWEKRCMDSEARLAAAERVVEAARVALRLRDVYEDCPDLAVAVDGYEKAYSAKQEDANG